MKNIILLSDGTGNSNIKDRGTNVFKLYEAIDFHSATCKQVAFYDDGVGTEEFKLLKIMGGAFGWGLSRNVRKLYKDLVQSYEEGDAIYLFGFSRGAFTVRSLVAFIAKRGILKYENYNSDEELERDIQLHYEIYREGNKAFLELPIAKLCENIYKPSHDLNNVHANCAIKFIGVWDTVDAVGLPFDAATNFLNDYIFRFKFSDYNLSKLVIKACQALSIDDERSSFKPRLWEHEERIEQVWFSGVHANVGGGYPQQGLSMVSLDWMMKKAKAAGIDFIATDLQFARDREYAFDKLYDSRSGLGSYYSYKPRDIAQLCNNYHVPPLIHKSAIQRIADGILNYAPGNFPDSFTVVDDEGIHPNSSQIVAIVNDSKPSKPIIQPLLLNDVKGLILQRVFLYYVAVCFTIFTLYQLILGSLATPNTSFFGAIKELVSPDSLLDKLVLLCWHHPQYAVTGAVIVGVAIWVRKKLASKFTEYWGKGNRRSQLKPLVPITPDIK